MTGYGHIGSVPYIGGSRSLYWGMEERALEDAL